MLHESHISAGTYESACLRCRLKKVMHLLENVGDFVGNTIDGTNSVPVRQVIVKVDKLLEHAPDLRAVFRKFVPKFIRERLAVV